MHQVLTVAFNKLYMLKFAFEIDVKYCFLARLFFKKGVNFAIIWSFLHLVFWKKTSGIFLCKRKGMEEKPLEFYVEILQLWAKFLTLMVPCLRFIWIKNSSCSSGHRTVWPANLLYKYYFAYRRFAVQTLLWSLEFVIQMNFKRNTSKV